MNRALKSISEAISKLKTGAAGRADNSAQPIQENRIE
jgi:hypothetical protein